MPEPTHVLVYTPPYLVEDGPGGWDLFTVNEYESGAMPDCPPGPDGSDPAEDPRYLAQWATAHLGYPVTLAASTDKIKPATAWRTLFSRWRDQPIYYVSPATD